MNFEKMLCELCEANGVSGFEDEAAQTAEKYLKAYTPEIRRDSMGSLIGHIPGDGVRILLNAHMDEIGLVVTAVDDKGFLRVAKNGGVDLRMLLGSEVTVWGSEPLYGVFCCQPPHLITSRDDYSKVPEITDLAVDIGFSAQRARELVHPVIKFLSVRALTPCPTVALPASRLMTARALRRCFIALNALNK